MNYPILTPFFAITPLSTTQVVIWGGINTTICPIAVAARLIDELPVIKVSQSTYFVTRRGMEFGAEFHGGALNEFLFE